MSTLKMVINNCMSIKFRIKTTTIYSIPETLVRTYDLVLYLFFIQPVCNFYNTQISC